MPAWRNWYHLIASTYGSWLPGDPRGFRTRHHREHVDGDYKQPPPPGVYDAKHHNAEARLKRETVVLTFTERHTVLMTMRGLLTNMHAVVLALSVGGMHMHVLAQLPPAKVKGDGKSAVGDPPRHLLGIAKRQSSRVLIRGGSRATGIWARRCKVVPIAHRSHQLNVFQYICEHADEGAVVWTYRDELPL